MCLLSRNKKDSLFPFGTLSILIWVTTDHSISKRAQAFWPSVEMKQSSKTKVSCFFDISSWKTLSMTEKSIDPFLSNANPLRMLSGRTDSCTNAETFEKLLELFPRVVLERSAA